MSASADVTETSTAKTVTICEHIKDNGIRCGSPAMRGRHFCYFHSRAHHPVGRFGHRSYRSPVPDSVASLQISLAHVMQALATGDIPPKQAYAMLFAVNIATKLLRLPHYVSPREIVTEIPAAMQEVLTPPPSPLEHESQDEAETEAANAPELGRKPVRPALTGNQIDRLARDLMTHLEIHDLAPTLGDGDSNPGYPEASRRLAAHWEAHRRLEEAGIAFDDARVQIHLQRRAEDRARARA